MPRVRSPRRGPELRQSRMNGERRIVPFPLWRRVIPLEMSCPSSPPVLCDVVSQVLDHCIVGHDHLYLCSDFSTSGTWAEKSCMGPPGGRRTCESRGESNLWRQAFSWLPHVRVVCGCGEIAAHNDPNPRGLACLFLMRSNWFAFEATRQEAVRRLDECPVNWASLKELSSSLKGLNSIAQLHIIA